MPAYVALPHFLELASADPELLRVPGLKDLYVSSQYVTHDVVVLENGTYKKVGSISKGLVSPDGDYVDRAGNLYVADYDGINIQEYKPGDNSPSFTYRHAMTDPINVSVDKEGNVYEADYDGYYVNEYAPKSNTVINSCSLGGGVEGVAIDANGDVFVDYNEDPTGPGKIAEYRGGLKGCHGTVLGATVDLAGGMVLDAKNNLVVADQSAAAVDEIAPPYSKITGTLGRDYTYLFHVTLNKENTLAFVAGLYLYVVAYPSGKRIATIKKPFFPAGAVDASNAVY